VIANRAQAALELIALGVGDNHDRDPGIAHGRPT
jgi:hypothetical protein